jgi:hypothetical protein
MAFLLKNITPFPSISTSVFLIRLVLSSLGLLYEASLFSMEWQKKFGLPYPSFHFRASLQEQCPECGSVTALFVRAIAADGKVRFVRESGEKVKCSAFLRCRHLRSVFTQEGFPFALSLSALA